MQTGEDVYVIPITKTLTAANTRSRPPVPNQPSNPIIAMRDEFIQKLVNLGYPLDYSERQFKYILDQLGLSERSTGDQNGTVKCRTCGGPHWTSKCTVAPSDSASDSTATSNQKPSTAYRPPVGQDTEHEYKIKISNLSEEVGEDELRDLVNPIGSVARVQVIKDRATNVSRGFAFVTFRNKDDVLVAIEKLNGRPFNHLILNVEAARPSCVTTGKSRAT